ncbi:MAG: hypothetical protein ACLFTV_08845, partial [Desulfococcaceae bacterium]
PHGRVVGAEAFQEGRQFFFEAMIHGVPLPFRPFIFGLLVHSPNPKMEATAQRNKATADFGVTFDSMRTGVPFHIELASCVATPSRR